MKQKRNFFHRHLDWLHSILKKMHRKFEGNRPVRKKVMLLQRMNWNAIPDLQFSQAGRKTLAYNCQQLEDQNLDLFCCFKFVSSLFQVFASFCPLSSPILPYPYLFTSRPNPSPHSNHVHTNSLSVASTRLRIQLLFSCFRHNGFKEHCWMHAFISKTNASVAW